MTLRSTHARKGPYSVSTLGGTAAFLLATSLANAEPFTLAVMPDTQSEATNTPQVKFPALTQWIADNKGPRNIKFVAHVGDLVNWETPNSTPPQFQYVNADKAMHTLELAGLPYSVDVGNHDTAAVGGVNADGTPCHCGGSAAPGDVHANLRNTQTLNQFFPLSRFVNVREAYEPTKMDNAYHTFSAGGLDWLVISSELDPRPGALAWFNKVVTEHPDHNVIYTTHNYLAPNGNLAGAVGYGDLSPQAVWDGLIKLHPNIRFVLSGHLTQTALRQTAGDSGDPVYQVLTDYQDDGNGWVRTLLIDPDGKTVTSQVYCPYLKVFKTGPTEAFTLTNVKLIPAKRAPSGSGDGGGLDSGANTDGGGGRSGSAGGGGVSAGSGGAGGSDVGAGGAGTLGGGNGGAARGSAGALAAGAAGPDAAMGGGAGVDGGTPGTGSADAGCGCRLVRPSRGDSLASAGAVAALLMFAAFRMRRRSGPSREGSSQKTLCSRRLT